MKPEEIKSERLKCKVFIEPDKVYDCEIIGQFESYSNLVEVFIPETNERIVVNSESLEYEKH